MIYVNGNKNSKEYTASPKKYPQKRFNTKRCRYCGSQFDPLAPSHLYCSDDCKDSAFSSAYLKRTYGITYKQYLELYKNQKGKCKICGSEGFKMAEYHKTLLVVDHCHETGKVRGLLCHNCNRGLGLFHDSKDDLLKAIEYLEGATTIL